MHTYILTEDQNWLESIYFSLILSADGSANMHKKDMNFHINLAIEEIK